MPIYEYRCDECGNEFEKLIRRPADTDALECPGCGQKHLSQTYSTFAAHNGGAKSAAPQMGGGCPAGMCQTPGLCGRN